jgi:transcription elongation factor GreB
MSKAFTREDDQPEAEPPRRLPSVLPPGAKNYLTPDGARRLRTELEALVGGERPARAATRTDPAAAARLKAMDERIHELQRALESAVIVGPPSEDLDVVRFGATVTVRTLPGGETVRYRIVGVDETDVARGWISWVSPVAKALLSAAVEDRVRAVLPTGGKELVILDVSYE